MESAGVTEIVVHNVVGEPRVATAWARLVDIIIPTHGRPDLLTLALDALAPQVRRSTEVQIIVVNDGTHDIEYDHAIAPYADIISYLPQAVNSGPAHARNEGARASNALFVVFLDDDCIAPPHWLNWLLALIEAMPDIDVFGGPTQPPVAAKYPKAIERFNRAFGLYPRPLFSRGELYCLPSANVAVRRDVFLRAGGFDVSFRYAAGEDLNFFYRLKMAGCTFHIDNHWYATHPVADRPKDFVRRWYRYGYGTAQHKIKSDDPHDYGVRPGSTYISVFKTLPGHQRYMRRRLEQGHSGDWLHTSAKDWPWERTTFPILAAMRQVAYKIGGAHAFAKEGHPTVAAAHADSSRSSKPQRRQADSIVRSSQNELTEFGLIIGAMKSGTSALFRALTEHPEIAACKLKEPSFFIDEIEFAKGEDWYQSLFAYRPGGHRIGVEATTRHTMWPAYRRCAERMQRTQWAFRFIYIVRNPFDRIRSHYMDASIRPLGIPPLSEGLHTFPLEVTEYHTQLKPYRDAFGRDRILVISHDDLVANPHATLARICDHLGVVAIPGLALETVHSSEYHYHRVLLVREVQSSGLASPDISANTIYEYLLTLSSGDREIIEARVRARYTPTDDHRAQIKAALADEMKLLRHDYGIDVGKWGF